MRKGFAFGMLAMFVCISLMAAVNGVFANVNATSGYQVNGAAGSSGQVLCSNGSVFNTPCSVYYQTVQTNGSALTQQSALNFNSTLSATNGSGVSTVGLPAVGTAGTYSSPTSVTLDAYGRTTSITASSAVGRTCNSNGCYRIDSDGTIEQWGSITGSASGTLTLPTPFTTTTYSITGSGGNNGGHISIVQISAISTSQATWNNVDNNDDAASGPFNWHAIGY